ncbi:actin-like ATPase domain-containing protein [Trichocladium antarcticum]|uniref:Actin-like ATPase domain-containing protein n=1 Tax=Trichocladium antarcticum TaxID=1450529 RepID=A0AAN6UET3_9PEZI|nr:actin-like ATPase domain-containing protein [Trichocladium antarcticum]
MSTPAGSALPHRSVANIRSPSGTGRHHHHSGSSTPNRSVASNLGSPSSLRADEEIIIIEFGTRRLQVGYPNDPAPRGCVWFAPEQQRRVGDFRQWQSGYRHEWRSAAAGGRWGRDHELWQYDVREVDLGLVGDKIERALREAFTKYMLIDSRPRRMVWVIPSSLPIPLLSAALDSVFSRFQPPTVSLLSSPLAVAVGAGVRTALVVDLGWRETAVTSIYEYREVDSSRSIRGGRMLVEQTHNSLAKHLPGSQRGSNSDNPDATHEYAISFEECSDIATRMVWCKPRQRPATATAPQLSDDGLATVLEQDEAEARDLPPTEAAGTVTIPLKSCSPPNSLELPFDALTEPCENAFFDTQYSPSSFDDHELPLHLLVYRSLLHLPLDVRALCMSRIIFTGGCANVLGLRGRIFDEVSHLVQEQGWDPVRGKGVGQLRANPKLKRRGARQAAEGPTGVAAQPDGGEEQDGVWHDSADTTPEVDLIEEQLKRGADKGARVHGELRAVESLGAWSGASLITHLKTPAIATIDREIWLQHGAAGASKAADVDHKNDKPQRQSLGSGGLMRGAAAASAWTLGVWGAN